MSSLPSGTVTFLFTDIEGSTKLAQQYPDAMPTLLARHHEILNQSVQAQNGYVFQIVGDSFAVAFHSASNALNAALDAQRMLQNETWTPAPIKVRMGIHTGAAQLSENNQYSGYATLASTQRIMSAGHGGQVLLSGATRELVRDMLPNDSELFDLGEKRLKDLLRPEHLYQLNSAGLLTTFPPLKTLDLFPNNLPLQLTSFIGRENDIAKVKQELETHRLVTLTGSGGTGKTRLSLQVAADLLEKFDHGVWFVELAPLTDPDLIPQTILSTIGVQEQPGKTSLDVLKEYLHEKQTLIVLDNCEHLVSASAQVANMLLNAAPKLKVLASSREALGVKGEMSYPVPSLSLPDVKYLPTIEQLSQYEAVRLFIDRALLVAPHFVVDKDNAPHIAQICYRLDGIPLAIELAVARIKMLSVEQISKRLDDRFRLLTGGARTALPRQQTLRALIDWSYDLLSENERLLLRRLSVFAGGWTLEAAEEVCSDSDQSPANGEQTDHQLLVTDILDLLTQLVNKSLVVVIEHSQSGETRYRMLETIRQYANEKLVELDESAALRDRHLEYFLSLAETAEPHLIRPEQLEWLAKLDADYENLRAAIEWALNQTSAEPALRLSTTLGWFWCLRGYWLEGTRWLDSALGKPSQPTKNENTVRLKALYQNAALANELDELERMQNSAERSLALAREFSDRRDLAIARFYVGWALERQADYERAIPLMEQSLAEFQEMNDLYWESVAYRWLANRLVIRGIISFKEKVDHHLELARKAGERKNLAGALANKARLLFDYNRLDEARMLADEASILFKQIGSNLNDLNILVGYIAWLEGDYEKARAMLMEMQERFGLSGEKNNRMMAIANLGCLALENGNLDEAHIYLENALATAHELNDKDAIMWRLAELGNTYYVEGKIEEYKQNYRESLLLAKEVSPIAKRDLLLLVLDSVHLRKPESSVWLMGAIHRFISNSTRPIGPLIKRSYDSAETHARKTLDDTKFKSAFTEGQKMSLDEALDLALKTIDEM